MLTFFMITSKSDNSKQPSPKQLTSRFKVNTGFTIVELLVVIVVIGILAAIAVVSYTGMTNKANTASIKTELANAAKKLSMYRVEHGSYPTTPGLNLITGCPTAPNNDTNYCIKFGAGTTITYASANSSSYELTFTKGTLSFKVSESGTIATTAINCPTGFIVVPGSVIYGTNDFCVMKYEAKNAGGSIPISRAAGRPFEGATQTGAVEFSLNTANCVGCHLISESEWMTISQNVLSVASNWSGGVVGDGYIYSGHNDASPAITLADDSNGTDGYSGTNNYQGDTSTSWSIIGDSQRRTLTLTNGNVIWDLAGNTSEWTSGSAIGGQPGVTNGGWARRKYSSITNDGTLSTNPLLKTMGITGSELWGDNSGIGRIYSSTEDSSQRAFLRGGNWNSPGQYPGILCLDLSYGMNTNGTVMGFRVAAPAQ